MESELLSIRVSQTDPQDPLSIHVGITRPFEAAAPSRLPYDEAVAMPAVLKALDATSFTSTDYEEVEVEWLQQEQLVNDGSGILDYSSTMRESIGEKLFQCLFPTEKMRSIFYQAQRNSQDIRREIHFQLCFDASAPMVGAYPWELLHHEEDFLIVGGRGTLTRYISFDSPPPFRELPSALSVLLVVPRPPDPMLGILDDSEAQAIRDVMTSVGERFLLHPQEVLTFAGLEELLSEHCGDDSPDIIHFDGHGAFGRRCKECRMVTTKRSAERCASANCPGRLEKPQGYLVFEDAQGRTDYRSADEFSDLIRQALVSVNAEARGGTRLIVLSACRSGVARGTEKVFSGVAQRLVDAGVPAVVAVQFSIRTDAAERFAKSVFQQIAKGTPLVTAMSWGRTALGDEGDQWYRPALYLRWRDNEGGQLFGKRVDRLDGQSVRNGLDALTDLVVAHPDARRAVANFCTGCQATCDNLALAGDYKAIHDLLHELQFKCYNSLEQDAPRFLDDDLAVDDITTYKLNLERIIDDLRTVFDRGLLPIGKAAWIQSLEQADTELSIAIETSDAKELKNALWHMNRVLIVQPFLINQSLKDAVTAARLSALVEKLTKVSVYLNRLGLDQEKLLQFQDGLQKLDQLSTSLTTLVTDHDLWQDLDVELRRVENLIRQDTVELEMSWPDVEAIAVKAFGQNGAQWAVNLQKFQTLLDQALAAGDMKIAKRQFKLFRRQAAERFYQVDAELKKRCDGLAMIGTSLTDMMRLVQ